MCRTDRTSARFFGQTKEKRQKSTHASVVLLYPRTFLFVIPSYRPSKSQLLLIVVFLGTALCDVHICRAAFLPVFGSPPFTQGIGGYKSNAAEENPILIASDSPVVVNDGGIAVGNTSRVDASGNTLDYRAVRWSAT